VDISVTVCLCVFVCVRLRISPHMIKLAAFSRRFTGVQSRESQIFGNFAPPEAQNRTRGEWT